MEPCFGFLVVARRKFFGNTPNPARNLIEDLGLITFVAIVVINAAARSHSGPAREAAAEIGSSVPRICFPVGYAVCGVLLTVFGYFAMLLSQ